MERMCTGEIRFDRKGDMAKRGCGTKMRMHVLQSSTRWDAGATREDRYVLETSCSGPCLWHLGLPPQHDEHPSRRAITTSKGAPLQKTLRRSASFHCCPDDIGITLFHLPCAFDADSLVLRSWETMIATLNHCEACDNEALLLAMNPQSVAAFA